MGDEYAAYLPPLEACLSGNVKIISWAATAEALTQPSLRSSKPLRTFLSDKSSINALSVSIRPSQPPDGQAKSDFDTRTAAINVADSEHSSQALTELKDDAIWLAKHARIDEITALRIAIVEWQDRSRWRMAVGLTEEAQTENERKLDPSTSVNASLPQARASSNSKRKLQAGDDHTRFSQRARRRRLLCTWFAEQASMLEVRALLGKLNMLSIESDESSELMTTEESEDDPPDQWLRKLHFRLCKAADPREEYPDPALAAFVQVLDTIHARLKSVHDSEKTIKEDSEREFALEHHDHVRTNILALLRFAYVLLNTSVRPTTSTMVLNWFKTFREFNLAHEIWRAREQQLQKIADIQSLLSILLLQLLDPGAAITYMESDSYAADWAGTYVLDPTCVETISNSVESMISSEAAYMAPVIFCWAALGHEIYKRLETADPDGVDRRDSLSPVNLHRGEITASSKQFSKAWKAYNAVADPNLNVVAEFASAALDLFSVYTSVVDLAKNIKSFLGHKLFDETSDLNLRLTLLGLLRYSASLASYNTGQVSALIAIVEDNPGDKLKNKADSPTRQKLVAHVLEDEILYRSLLNQAIQRYPIETRPFLEVFGAAMTKSESDDDHSTMNLLELLRQNPRFTDTVPDHFYGYEATRESEDEDVIVLRENMPIFKSTQRPKTSFASYNSKSLTLFNTATELAIPDGTEGDILTKAPRLIVSWKYPHSTLPFLGRRLYELQSERDVSNAMNSQTANMSSDIIEFLTRLLNAVAFKDGSTAVEDILSETSDALSDDTDVLDIVMRIFERNAFRQILDDDTETIVLLARCLDLLAAVIDSIPGRVWPALLNQTFYDANTNDSRLMTITTSFAKKNIWPALCNSIVSLFDQLIDDIVRHAVDRAAFTKTRTNRFDSSPSVDPGIPIKQMDRIVNVFTRYVLAIIRLPPRTSPGVPDGYGISSQCFKALRRLLSLAFSFGGSSSNIHPALHSSASFILDSFLDGASTSHTGSALISSCSAFLETAALDLSPDLEALRVSEQVMELLLLVMKVSESRALPTNDLACQIMQSSPFMLQLYAKHSSLRNSSLALLTKITHAAGQASAQSRSFFTYLNPGLAQDAVCMLGDTPGLICSPEIESIRYTFFSTCLNNHINWFTGYLITGDVPSGSRRATDSVLASPVPKRAQIDVALDISAAQTEFETSVYVAMLQFIVDALNNWTWSLNRIHDHSSLLTNLANQLENLRWTPSSDSQDSIEALAWRTKAASLICEIFAMYLHGMRVTGREAIVKEWASKIPLLDQPGFKDPVYNTSLHQRLAKNIESQYHGLTLQDLSRKGNEMLEYGKDFYYDTSYAAQLLSSSAAWTGAGLGNGNGYKQEFHRANVNLSLVDAQRRMMAKWKLLCLELAKDTTDDEKLHKKLAYVVHECLEANKEAESTESVFKDLRLMRVDLAINIMQRLVELQYTGNAMRSLLVIAWSATRAAQPDFNYAFFGPESNYYRLCVKLLLLCLRPYTYANLFSKNEDNAISSQSTAEHSQKFRAESTEANSTIVEIATEVVAKGFRSLAAQLHEDKDSVIPADFSMLTSLLQSILQIRGAEVTNLHSQIAFRLAEFDLGRYAIALFTWSDQANLQVNKDDPFYGDISLSFLVELSGLPAVAELLATDGVLSRLNTASLMGYFQRAGGTHPFDTPLRAHKIWTRGILPLVLNVLLAVGAPFAAEAATFLNNYLPQLKIASNALDGKGIPTSRQPLDGGITYNVACEAHTLALISIVLDQYRAYDDADIPDLLWDRIAVKEDVDTWIQGTRAFLRERIVPVGDREIALARMKPLGGDKELCECHSRLEELILKELKGTALVLNGNDG